MPVEGLEKDACSCGICGKSLPSRDGLPPPPTLVEVFRRKDESSLNVSSIWLVMCRGCRFRGILASGPATILKVAVTLATPALVLLSTAGVSNLAGWEGGPPAAIIAIIVGLILGLFLGTAVHFAVVRWSLRERQTGILAAMNISDWGITANLRVH